MRFKTIIAKAEVLIEDIRDAEKDDLHKTLYTSSKKKARKAEKAGRNVVFYKIRHHSIPEPENVVAVSNSDKDNCNVKQPNYVIEE